MSSGDTTDELETSSLFTVLGALRSSRKGKLKYDRNGRIDLQDDTSEICDLKNVGDLERVQDSNDFSFSQEEENEATQTACDAVDSDISKFQDSNKTADPPERTKKSKSMLKLEIQQNTEVADPVSPASYHIKSLYYQLEQLRLEQDCKKGSEDIIRDYRKEFEAKIRLIREEHEIKHETYSKERAKRIEEQQEKQELERKKEKDEMIKVLNQLNERAAAQSTRVTEKIAAAIRTEKLAASSSLQKIQKLYKDYTDKINDLQQKVRSLGNQGSIGKENQEFFDQSQQNISLLMQEAEENLQSLTEEKAKTAQKTLAAGFEKIQQELSIVGDKTREALEAERLREQQEKEEQERKRAEEEAVARAQQEAEQTAAAAAAAPPPPPQSAESSSREVPFYSQLAQKVEVLRKKQNECAEAASSMVEQRNMHHRAKLAKAVGIINQLNSVNSSANREKLQKIISLLNGKPITVSDSQVGTENNPAALAFVKEMLASRLVSLGSDKQVANMAVYASFIFSLWIHFPDLGELILFRLYDTCPYLVPLNPQRQEGQSDVDYCKSIGRKWRDSREEGAPENFDLYLKRMGNASRLYSRIIAMQVRQGSHPHGIQHGWYWICALLSLPPVSGTTATIILGFLETAGNAMLKAYNRQFQKVLNYMIQNYIPCIEAVTEDGGIGALSLLKKFLETFVKTGKINQPEGGTLCHF
ncbi:gle1 RNA export mediator [Oratosquilla oratoria]|uniref:gle1 RNA export mediator n=1 Tax=Oratosquilla oratoria TaxID=337810 RepID=UPI003F761866